MPSQQIVNNNPVKQPTTEEQDGLIPIVEEDNTPYCICRRPSMGTMVCCENPKVLPVILTFLV